MSEAKHTPTPWSFDPVSDVTIAICNERGDHVCILEKRDDGDAESRRESDAALIILAANSHDALVAAAEAMLDAFRHIPVEAVDEYAAVEAARKGLKAAIALAKGEET